MLFEKSNNDLLTIKQTSGFTLLLIHFQLFIFELHYSELNFNQGSFIIYTFIFIISRRFMKIFYAFILQILIIFLIHPWNQFIFMAAFILFRIYSAHLALLF